MAPLAIVVSFVTASLSHGATFLSSTREDPKGPGLVEKTMEAACDECKVHAPYLSDCTCFATDVMGTFEDDATKTLTTREEYGFKTEQTGLDRLAEGWTWHCRPVSASDAWQQC